MGECAYTVGTFRSFCEQFGWYAYTIGNMSCEASQQLCTDQDLIKCEIMKEAQISNFSEISDARQMGPESTRLFSLLLDRVEEYGLSKTEIVLEDVE